MKRHGPPRGIRPGRTRRPPASLAICYAQPGNIPARQPAGSGALVAGLTAFALWQARRRPYLPVGWLWYLGTLVPVIGLVQAGGQAYADRYTYVPLIGIFIAVAWGVPALIPERRFRTRALAALAGMSLIALTAAARVQAGYWRDNIALYSRAAAVTENNRLALDSPGAGQRSRP